MTVRSLSAVAVVAAALGTVAAPAMARTVHVMGMTFEQPGYGVQDETVTTGSLTRRGSYDARYDGYDARAAARPAANANR